MIDHQTPGALPRRLLQALRLGLLALAVTLASCGGGDDGDVTDPGTIDFQVVAGDAVCPGGSCQGDGGGGGAGGDGGSGGGDGAGGGLGAMRNVKVIARKPDGTVLGSAMLQNNLVSIYDRGYKGAFVLEFADDGSGNAEYFDEADEAWIRMNGQALHILVPRLTHHVSANPLTEAAYQWALNKYGTEAALDAARMTEANEVVRQAFNLRVTPAYQVSDITNYAAAVSNTTAANSLPNTHAGRFGTLLAAMPRAARLFLPSLPAPGLAFMRQLVKDIRDDGTVNASSEDAEDEAYDASLSEKLTDALIDARAQYGVAEQPPIGNVPSACFNPALFAVGTKWSLDYTDIDSDGFETPVQLTLEATRLTTFETYASALEVKTVTTIGTAGSGNFRAPLGVSAVSVTSYGYTSPDLSQGIVNYGSDGLIDFQGLTLRSVNVLNPPSTNRQFLLRPGESETLTITGTVTLYNPDGSVFPGGGPSTDTQTTTFVGYEDVTVRAGTYKGACHYTVTDARQNTTEYWYTSGGQGVPVLIVDGSTRSELVSGTVNGVGVK